jgi:6-phosphofructokinase
MAKCIGILTGGGDVPGLNSVIKEVTYRATENNCERGRHPAGMGGADRT